MKGLCFLLLWGVKYPLTTLLCRARLTQWPQVTIRGLPPLILWSPSLAFWFRASIQRARTFWLESLLLEHYCAFEQVIYFSGPVFSSCSNAADQPLCTVSRNIRFSKKKLKVKLPHASAIPLLAVHPKELKIGSQRDTCAPIFIAALITIAESWKQLRCPSSTKWINVMRSIHASIHSALKTLTFLIHTTTWRKLENITLSDLIQILYDSSSMEYWEQSKS